jgi:phosphonopyruvate decarboxylase
MGHASSISQGLALAQPNRRVVCLDGDGALLMHMGSLAVIAQSKPKNLIHVVLNNGAHDSVGGQPTCAFQVEISEVARACGYKHVKVADDVDSIQTALYELTSVGGPSLLEIRLKKGARDNLSRPTQSPSENRDALMAELRCRVK